MPNIYDNIENGLLPALAKNVGLSSHVDFCVGYFNLRGWESLDDSLAALEPQPNRAAAQVMIGMIRTASDELRTAMQLANPEPMDNKTAARLREEIGQEFRRQLTVGMPTRRHELALLALRERITSGHTEVKLFLEHQLHAKLYLCHLNPDQAIPRFAFMGSSNLTFSGLEGNGELNVDVTDDDATKKLADWFDERWKNKFCVSVNEQMVTAIDESWASEVPVLPYLVYLKMAYHLSEDARAGLLEFDVPPSMAKELLAFQANAIQIAARHLRRRGGVLIGDVVGLGKSMVGTALALLCQETFNDTTLIICPKNLVSMWEGYVTRYGLHAKVMSLSRVLQDLPGEPMHQIVMIDESHNLRNRDGLAYAAVRDYISDQDARCILLTATPYNKSFADLGSQLRLFLDEDADLGIQPEALKRSIDNETEFLVKVDGNPSSIRAFEASPFVEDWQELMRHFMIRRTRSFIKDNYAETDDNGRQYLTFADGTRSYFPERIPKNIKHKLDGPDDPAGLLFSDDVVDTLNALKLPRYSLGRYVEDDRAKTADDRLHIANLERANVSLAGLTRSSLFKRLESSGFAFVKSVQRHRVRNLAFVHALDNNLPVPGGTISLNVINEDLDSDDDLATLEDASVLDAADGASAYNALVAAKSKAVTWISPYLFDDTMRADLIEDNDQLAKILGLVSPWDPAKDSKARTLLELVTVTFPGQKLVVFTEFADTANYLGRYLTDHGVDHLAVITGGHPNPAEVVQKFSPRNNPGADVAPADEHRILIATDVLSEGQNLQDAAIVAQYDLPWAIVKLVQRAGRVDRIGQQAEQITVCSFVPAEGIEKVLGVRRRVTSRLRESGEVVGGDDVFFEDEKAAKQLRGLYDEKSEALDDVIVADTEVDLGSFAYEVWRNAIAADEAIEREVLAVPDVVTATRSTAHDPAIVEGVLSYLRTDSGIDALIWVAADGTIHSHSPLEILRAAACPPETPALARDHRHFPLLEAAAGEALKTTKSTTTAGALTGIRKKVWNRLGGTQGQMLGIDDLDAALAAIYERPLRQRALITLQTKIRDKIATDDLAALIVALHRDDELCVSVADRSTDDVRIICSVGLFQHPTPDATHD